MPRKACQCGSSCACIGCLDCCDCGAELAGPIERELRAYPFETHPNHWASGDFSMQAFEVLEGAARHVGGFSRRWMTFGKHLPDYLSEAIEAAEALGL